MTKAHWLFHEIIDPFEPKKKGLEHWLFKDVKIPPKPKEKKKAPTPIPKHEIFKDIPKITWKQLQLTKEPIKLPTLRPYQKEALDKWLIMKKGIIMIPTGTGKTLIALEAIKRVDGTVAIIVPTIPILKTVWVEPMRKMGWNVGVFYGEETHDVRAITVFTYQSAIRYPEVLKNFGFLVFDEIHHLSAPIYRKLLVYAERAEYAMGLTATISTRDPKNYEIFKIMPIVYRMSIVEARKGGWVAPIQVTSVPAFMTSEERSEYYDLQDKIRSATIRLGTTDPTVWAKLAAEGNIIAQSGLKALAKRRALLSLVKDKMKHVLEIVRKHPGERILLFSESIPAIEKLRDYLIKHGVTCAVYHSEMPKDRRMNVLRYWGRIFNVLLSVTALEEGIDVPEVSVGIIHASGRTPRKIVQRLGRIIRPKPGKTAMIYIVYVPGTVEENVKNAVLRAVREVR